MGFLRKLIPREIRAPVAAVLAPIAQAIIPGPLGALAASGIAASLTGSLAGTPVAQALPAVRTIVRNPGMSLAVGSLALPGLGMLARTGGRAMTLGIGSLTARGVGFAGGALVGAGVRSAKAIYGAAAGYCRRHPGWCTSIGGLAAVEALISSGQLPIPRRRRGRGLSAGDLRSFRRVAKLIKGYCPTVRRVPSRKLGRS